MKEQVMQKSKQVRTRGTELETGCCERLVESVRDGGLWQDQLGCRDQAAVHRESLWWQQSGSSGEWGWVREEGLRGSWLRNQPSLWMIQLTAPPRAVPDQLSPETMSFTRQRCGQSSSFLSEKEKRKKHWIGAESVQQCHNTAMMLMMFSHILQQMKMLQKQDYVLI